MNADALNSLIAEWARTDSHKPAEYVAPVSALAARLETIHRCTLESLSRAAQADAYIANAGRFYVVGFRSGPNSESFARLAKCLTKLGFRARLTSSGEFRVSLPPVAELAESIHAAYVSALATERAVRAARG